jgi:hypothetical protein
MPPPSHPPWLDNPNICWSTNYGAPHYALLSSLISHHPSQVQIFSWAPCCQHLQSVFLKLETKLCNHTKQQTKLQFCIFVCFNLFVFGCQDCKTKICVPQIESALNFFPECSCDLLPSFLSTVELKVSELFWNFSFSNDKNRIIGYEKCNN